MLSILLNMVYFVTITPRGIRIPVTSVKGRCPRPLDDGGYDVSFTNRKINHNISVCQVLLINNFSLITDNLLFHFLRF